LLARDVNFSNIVVSENSILVYDMSMIIVLVIKMYESSIFVEPFPHIRKKIIKLPQYIY
jgi:hypothetical protein